MGIFFILERFFMVSKSFFERGAVSPMYFSVAPSLEDTVAWYTMFFSRHSPSRGQTVFFGQLHFLVAGLGWFWLRIFELCADIILAKFGVHI